MSSCASALLRANPASAGVCSGSGNTGTRVLMLFGSGLTAGSLAIDKLPVPDNYPSCLQYQRPARREHHEFRFRLAWKHDKVRGVADRQAVRREPHGDLPVNVGEVQGQLEVDVATEIALVS